MLVSWGLRPLLTDDEAFTRFHGYVTAGDVRYAGQWRTACKPAFELIQRFRTADGVNLDLAAMQIYRVAGNV